MFVVFYGNDTVGVRGKAYAYTAPFEEKGYSIERIDADSYQQGILADAAGSASLFGGDTLYVIDTPSADTDFYEEVVEYVEVLRDSAHPFVIIEGPLLASEKKKFDKHAESLEEVKGVAGERFNTFALADALAQKDKKNLWLLLTEAKKNASNEELIGILWWQLKSLRLAKNTNSAGEAGMKDFPYNKAKRALGTFSEGELERLSRELLAIYHDGHLGKVDIDLALEAWTLRL